MRVTKGEVVVVGGGVVGMATAYFLGRRGIKSIVIERDSIGSHASGFAYGGLSPLGGVGIPGPTYPLAQLGMQLHVELSQALPGETGLDVGFRRRSSLGLAFSQGEAQRLKEGLAWQETQPGYAVRWLEPVEVAAVDPRISPETVGGVLIEGGAEVEPYKFLLALAQAAEGMGATVRHGTVTGLKRRKGRVIGVTLGGDEIACERVVVAAGPWSGESSGWLGVRIEVRPLKGQIVRLRAPGPPLECSIGWSSNYATTKADGLVWAGSTEEEAGFDEGPTSEARDSIMASLLRMMPSLADSGLVRQTACLRPLSADGLVLLGPVAGWEGVYVATGAGRKGILLGPAMGRVTGDLISDGATDVALDELAPGRFSGAAADGRTRRKPASTFLPGA